MEVEKKFIRLSGFLILSLFCLGIRESWGDAVSRYRFYDTYKKMRAEKELDWRVRKNKVENLRLKFEATYPEYNSNCGDYINYLNRREKDYRGLLSKEEDILSAPYFSSQDRRNISKSYQKQIREVTDYYSKLRSNYYDYLNKSAFRRMVGYTVGTVLTFATAGQALPTLFTLQSGKFVLDEVISNKFGLEVPVAWRAISLMYDSGFSLYGVHRGFQNAASLANNGQKFLGSIEHIQAHYTFWQPVFNEYSRDHPDSFTGRGLPGTMAGLNLCSNIANTANVPKGRYLSKSSWNYPESAFRIGSAISDTVTIDYAIRGKGSWAANHPGSSFYLQQGCRLTDAGQSVIATHLGTKEFNKAADLKLAQAYEAASKIGDKPTWDYVGNNEVAKSLTCREVRSHYVDSPRKVPSRILQNPYQFAKLRYERAGWFLQEYVSQARADNPKAAVANPFLFSYEDSSSYSNYEDYFSCLSNISLGDRDELSNHNRNNSSSLTNLYAEAPTNYTFPGGNFSVSATNDGVKYGDYLDKGINSELMLGKLGEFKRGTIWTDEKFKLGRANHSESFSLDWGEKFANADPKAFRLIEGLKVVGPDGEIWEVDMIGGPRNIDGTFSNGKSEGYWSGGLDRHGQILPTGSAVLVDTKHQNYYTQLSKGFAPERVYWNNNFTSNWQGNYLFNQLNQPSRNFFEDFGSPFLEDFTPQTIAQKYDPWLQNYTLYGGGVEQIQDASGRALTYNRTDYSVEMIPVLGAKRGIEPGEFWKVEPGQAIIGNLKTGKVRESSLSGRGGELVLRENPTPVEVYTGEWRSKTREKVFEGNRFEAKEGFRRSIVNMDNHLNTGMANLVEGLQHKDERWIKQSQDNFVELGNERNEAIAQGKIERKVLDISETVIGTREHPKIDLSFYRDSEGKVIGYSYLPHERELQDSRNFIDKKRDLLPRQGDIDRLQEGSKGYGRIIDKDGKNLLNFVCGLGQTKAMEDVLEGSQRVHSRLVNLSREEPKTVFSSGDYLHRRSELIGETVKFIARENKLSVFSLTSGLLSQMYSDIGYNLKIVVSKDKYELADYPIKASYQWEMAKSFESDPQAPRKFTLKIDPIDKRVTQSWAGEKLKWSIDGGFLSGSLSSPQGYFVTCRLDTTIGYGQSKKTEFLEGTFLGISHRNTYRVSEKFLCQVALAYLLAHGIVAAPYAVPAPVPIGLNIISSYEFIPSSGNLQEE